MKRIAIVVSLILLPTMLWAAEQTLVLEVRGNCKSCQKKIEKASNSVNGVEESSWDKKAKKLTVTFDDSKTNKNQIVDAVLKAGYDADGKTAPDDAYEALPDCCKYRD